MLSRAVLLLAILMIPVAGCAGAAQGNGVTSPPATVGIQGVTRYTQTGAQQSSVFRNSGDPSPRYQGALAFDPDRAQFVLFGGLTAKGTSGETWLLKVSGGGAQARDFAWRQVNPAHNPPPRRGAAMAWDPRDHVLLMYGGLIPDQGEGTEGYDTWAWNGTDWSQVASDTTQPGRRYEPSMVTAGDHVLLFGGHLFNTQYYGDVWTWNSRQWTHFDRDPRPPGRGHAAAIWNPTASTLFVFGGVGARPEAGPGNIGTPLADAWQLEDGAWSQLPAGPPALTSPYAIWNPGTGSVDVFGVLCPSDQGVGWQWAGQKWSDLKSSRRTWGEAVAQDTKGDVVEFGGSNEPAC